MLALRALRRAGLQREQKILVNGASGSIGTRGGAAGQALRRPDHGRLRHQQHGPGEVSRRRPRNRLHQIGLHERRPALRHRLRRRRQELVPPLPAAPHARRRVPLPRPRVSLARPDPRAADSVHRHEYDGRRSLHRGDRQALPAESDRRRVPVRGHGSENRERRHQRGLTAACWTRPWQKRNAASRGATATGPHQQRSCFAARRTSARAARESCRSGRVGGVAATRRCTPAFASGCSSPCRRDQR
jgi:hypothetical protein